MVALIRTLLFVSLFCALAVSASRLTLLCNNTYRTSCGTNAEVFFSLGPVDLARRTVAVNADLLRAEPCMLSDALNTTSPKTNCNLNQHEMFMLLQQVLRAAVNLYDQTGNVFPDPHAGNIHFTKIKGKDPSAGFLDQGATGISGFSAGNKTDSQKIQTSNKKLFEATAKSVGLHPKTLEPLDNPAVNDDDWLKRVQKVLRAHCNSQQKPQEQLACFRRVLEFLDQYWIKAVPVAGLHNTREVFPAATLGQRIDDVNRTLSSKIENLERDTAKLKRDNAEFKQEIQNLERDTAKLKQDTAKLKRDNAKLKRDNAELKEKIENLERDNAEFKQRLHDFDMWLKQRGRPGSLDPHQR